MLRVLELYCGIGGLAAALADRADVVAALDINHHALSVYRHNHPHPALARTLESLSATDLRRWRADLWWLSPPCQPFTRRGLQRDDDDPRTASLLALLPHLARERPPFLALENVPGFLGSRTHGRLSDTLETAGYEVWEGEICPSELGLPNRRRRAYVAASREGKAEPPPRVRHDRALVEFLDPLEGAVAAELQVESGLLERYASAIDTVRATDREAVTACFTSAYGRSPVRSGSYLVDDRGDGVGVRRFSPGEVLRLLGFPEGFGLPEGVGVRAGWRLVGNSLSLPAVRAALGNFC